jgi:alpha-tubulin suppressor-like RCC1 family protein
VERPRIEVPLFTRYHFGQLGNGTSASDSCVPVTVLGITNATAVAVSTGATIKGNACAVLSTGSVQCWGSNDIASYGLVPKTLDGF